MSTERREELALDIFLADNSNGAEAQMIQDWEALCLLGGGYTYAHNTADGLIAKGYRKLYAIKTAEELDALPIGTRIQDSDPELCVKEKDGWRGVGHLLYESGELTLPAIVLYTPEPTR